MAYLIHSRMRSWLGSAMLAVWLVSVLLLGSFTPALAQVTYTVFPAVSSTASGSQPTNGEATVTLKVRDSTVAYVVRAIVHQAGKSLLCDFNSPLFSKRVSANIDRVKVLDALASVLRGTGLVATQTADGETVMIRPLARSLLAGQTRQEGIVTGRVTDSASGAGLSGASVKVAGTTLAAITSDSGRFMLKGVPAGDQVLMVRLFGYKPAERTVTVVDSQRTTVRIVMVSVPTVIGGVVTTATGVQRKVEVGSDITTLNVDSIRQVAPITSVTDLLETRVPGLTVLHSSGTPGDPSRLRLRGAGSIQGNNDPIVVVDGVRVYASQSNTRNNNLAPGMSLNGIVNSNNASTNTAPSPLDQIDPASIATIEVLKGPSATATYGSDAASGVIVITTKQGRAGPTHWELSLGEGVNWSPGRWPVNEFRFGYDSTSINGSVGLCPWYLLTCHVDSVVAFQALNDPRYTVFSHGSDQTANLSVSGGVPTLTYSVGGSGAGDLGLLKLPSAQQARYDSAYGATVGTIPHTLVRPDNYTTWGVNGTLTALPSPALRVTVTSSVFTSMQQQGSLNNAIPQLAGAYIGQGVVSSAMFNNTGNELPLVGYVEHITDEQATQTNILSLHWQPVAWLPLDATGGLSTIERTDHTYVPFGVSKSSDLDFSLSRPLDTTGHYGIGRGVSHDQTLNVGTVIPLRLMTLALGGNLVTETTTDFSASTDQLAPGISAPTTFLCPPDQLNCGNVSQSTAGASTYGWYVEPRLNIASRFFVAPGFRLDGGSGGAQSGYSGGALQGLSAFPKMDFSWVAIDRQGGHPLFGALTLLRPRVAFGLAGTQPFPQQKLRLYNEGAYTAASPYVPNTGAIGGQNLVCQPLVSLDGVTQVPAVCLNNLGNTQLRPERTRELEGGIDATLWQNRLSLTYTQYIKRTQDAIESIPVAPSATGISTMFTNIGVIRNTGTELTVDAVVLQRRAVSWTLGANLTNENSLVVRLNPGQAPICLGVTYNNVCTGSRVTAGYPLFGEWARPIASFADANHDHIIEPWEIQYGDSAVYVGQPNPKYQLNLTTGISLLNGRLSANATFAYESGLTQDNQGACNSNAFLMLPNVPTTPLATQAAIVASNCGNLLTQYQNIGNFITTPIGLIQTVNTLRFNALSINYEVPRSIASWFRAPHMSVALQGSNLALRTNYRGKDPDVNGFATVSAGDETQDLGQLPQPRTWWLKLTLGN